MAEGGAFRARRRGVHRLTPVLCLPTPAMVESLWLTNSWTTRWGALVAAFDSLGGILTKLYLGDIN